MLEWGQSDGGEADGNVVVATHEERAVGTAGGGLGLLDLAAEVGAAGFQEVDAGEELVGEGDRGEPGQGNVRTTEVNAVGRPPVG